LEVVVDLKFAILESLDKTNKDELRPDPRRSDKKSDILGNFAVAELVGAPLTGPTPCPIGLVTGLHDLLVEGPLVVEPEPAHATTSKIMGRCFITRAP
jgi:hypothetical protein